MLMMRIVLATACCRFGSGGLVITFVQTLSIRFGQDFEVEVQARFEAGVCILLLMFCKGNEVESWSRF